MNNEYNEKTQELFISFLLSSNEVFVRTRNIIKYTYFDKKFQKAVKSILDYADKYSTLPTIQHVEAESSIQFGLLNNDEVKQLSKWFLENIETFCKHKAMEFAIESSVKYLEQGKYSLVQDMVRDALLISLNKELGLDLFRDPVSFIENLKLNDRIKSTGWKTIDEKLYGGFNPGELNLFAGAPGTGKSLFLQNLALNWVEMGLDVVYLTLELSQDLTGIRLNSMISGKPTREVFRDASDIGLSIKTMHKMKKWGDVIIKFMPIGTNANDIKSYLREYEIQKGKRPDCLIVDYLDLLQPNGKMDLSNLFVKDKYVSEELRSLLQEYALLGGTASQLNRASINEPETDMSHIAGGISKINTADNVMHIHTSQQLKDNGQIRLYFTKTRSSSGVGSSVYLGFDNASLRIKDIVNEDIEERPSTMSEFTDKLKRKGKIEEQQKKANESKLPPEPPTPTGGSENAKIGAGVRNLLVAMQKHNADI